MIRIEKLNKIYGKGTRGAQVTALQDINLEIEDGDIYGIIGLSGAGKSTLFRCILGGLPDYGGSILLDGRDARTLKVPRRAACISTAKI